MILRDYLVFNYMFSLVPGLVEKVLNHFEAGPVRDVTSLLTKPSQLFFSFFLLGANNSRDRAGRARHADRQTEGKCFSRNKEEGRSPFLNLSLSLCEAGFGAI